MKLPENQKLFDKAELDILFQKINKKI